MRFTGEYGLANDIDKIKDANESLSAFKGRKTLEAIVAQKKMADAFSAQKDVLDMAGLPQNTEVVTPLVAGASPVEVADIVSRKSNIVDSIKKGKDIVKGATDMGKTGAYGAVAGLAGKAAGGTAGSLLSGVGSGVAVGAKFGVPGAAIGGTLGALSAILGNRAKEKQRQAKVKAEGHQAQARITGDRGQRKQQALQNMAAGFRAALIR